MFLSARGESDRTDGANGTEICFYFYLPDFSIGK